MRILNASGCLDALTAPDVARSLDAFVSKTVTPLPREGNAPVRIAETEAGMLNSIGLANPGRDRFLAENLPRLRELGVPLWISVGGFSAYDYAETCARLEDRDHRAQPVLPERRGSRTHGRMRSSPPAVRPRRCPFTRSSPRPTGTSPRSPARSSGRRGRALAREHHPWPQAGRADAVAFSRSRPRRLLRPCAQADCAGRRLLLPSARSSCRSSGWGGPDRARRPRICCRRSKRRGPRDRPLHRPEAPVRIREELAAEVAALGHSHVDELQGTAHSGIHPQPGVETSRA